MGIAVSRLMKTHVVALSPSETLATALARMVEAGVRHLPLVDRNGHLVGVVSQRDVLRAIDVMRTAEGKRSQLRVGDVMQREVYKVTPELPAHEAAAMMIEHKIGMLPVVDGKDRVVGIVTETDFLEVAREALLGVVPSQRASA